MLVGCCFKTSGGRVRALAAYIIGLCLVRFATSFNLWASISSFQELENMLANTSADPACLSQYDKFSKSTETPPSFTAPVVLDSLQIVIFLILFLVVVFVWCTGKIDEIDMADDDEEDEKKVETVVVENVVIEESSPGGVELTPNATAITQQVMIHNDQPSAISARSVEL